MRHRKLTQIPGGWIAATVFVVVAMAPGCSTQQIQSPPQEQSQKLPTVGSLDD